MLIESPEAIAERDALVALSQVTHIGPVRLGRLRDHFGSLSDAWNAPKTTLRQVLDERACRAVLAARQRFSPAEVTGNIARTGIAFATVLDNDYPRILRGDSRAATGPVLRGNSPGAGRSDSCDRRHPASHGVRPGGDGAVLRRTSPRRE